MNIQTANTTPTIRERIGFIVLALMILALIWSNVQSGSFEQCPDIPLIMEVTK
jgi:cytochrome b